MLEKGEMGCTCCGWDTHLGGCGHLVAECETELARLAPPQGCQPWSCGVGDGIAGLNEVWFGWRVLP